MDLHRLTKRAARGPRGYSRWLKPDDLSKHYIACCDCSLTHQFQFRIVTDESGRQTIHYRARRAERYTAAERRKRKG